jgi:hypothetical protein
VTEDSGGTGTGTTKPKASGEAGTSSSPTSVRDITLLLTALLVLLAAVEVYFALQ